METFGKLYEELVTCLDAVANPHVYPEVNESLWNLYSDTETIAHGLNSQHSFGIIVGFTVLKNSLDYLKGLSAKVQRKDINVFGAISNQRFNV